ncbi:MAG TPA: GNAT family N-acetyltransferase [Oscillospiraceae bacterium]|nr:GNAT family N-acetyltransferase [Oscillospiraceae bacterium]HPK34664.1 GNAT family N-acetyltransferase [Oscillospiraceae bacterium]HPR74572.1 GNAT family N-acetyltransferase [Oscillospiraceae bacterium]
MKFQRYDSTQAFGADALEILLRHEVQNNLPIGFIKNERGYDTANWLMATVKDGSGSVVLTAACTPPFNIIMYETDNKPNDAAVKCFSDALKEIGFALPGVLAEQGLAYRFAETYAGKGAYLSNHSMYVMRLDKVNPIQKAPGFCRELTEDDLFFVPYWERAFGQECGVEYYDIPAHVAGIKKRLGKHNHYFWVDTVPVAQASSGRSTENGAVINYVYTPPHYRGKGYASSVVAELSQMQLDRGKKFCCLFADAHNPISCGIYHKLGYVDRCIFDELKFLPADQ